MFLLFLFLDRSSTFLLVYTKVDPCMYVTDAACSQPDDRMSSHLDTRVVAYSSCIMILNAISMYDERSS